MTRAQTIADLERRMEEGQQDVNARIDLLNTQMTESMQEIHTLLRDQIPRVVQQHTPPPRKQNPPYSTPISKIEFLRFDGKNINDCLYKCDQFFFS